jgi:hypothetical protein
MSRINNEENGIEGDEDVGTENELSEGDKTVILFAIIHRTDNGGRNTMEKTIYSVPFIAAKLKKQTRFHVEFTIYSEHVSLHFENGVLHRNKAAALINRSTPNDSCIEMFYKEGKLHNALGPAFVFTSEESTCVSYWLKGKPLSHGKYIEKMNHHRLLTEKKNISKILNKTIPKVFVKDTLNFLF